MAAAREGVGDSSRDVLGNVRRTTKALLQAATEEEGEDSRPKELEDFISERDVLRLQWIESAADLQLGKGLSLEALPDSDGRGEFSMEAEKKKVKKLEEELLSMKLQSLQEVKLLECLQQQDYLIKHLFPEQSDSESETLVQGIVHQHTELASKLLYIISELEKSKKDVSVLKQDRSAAEYQCRELMAKLRKFEEDGDCSDQEEDFDSDRAQQLVRRSRDEVILLKRTLLLVIFGSSVDWSREEDLCELVVKLGLQS